MSLFKKNISDKLKSVFTTPLSEEDRIARHFISYATSITKTSHHTGIISLKIIEKEERLSAMLYKGTHPIKTIAMDEIPLFFTDRFSASLIGKRMVEEKLKKYFKTFQGISSLKSVGVCLVILKEEQIKIYTLGMQSTSEVVLSEFISFFKS